MANTSRILLVEPDPFLGQATAVSGFVPRPGKAKSQTTEADRKLASKMGFTLNDIQEVSRPIRGIVAKPNTHAFVQVIDAAGKVIRVFNKLGEVVTSLKEGTSGGTLDKLNIGDRQLHESTPSTGTPNSDAWTDWILQSVAESRVEKTQVVETFGDTYLYAFGQKPRALVFNGLLMNTTDYNWRAVFWENWDNFFRATRLIELNARMYISWDDIVVEGYPINAVCNQLADSPNAMTFSFNFFVTRYINVDADKGFLRDRFRGDNIAALTDYDPKNAKIRFNNKLSAIELLGMEGSTFIGGEMEKRLLAGTDTTDEVAVAQARLAASTVAAAHSAVTTGVLKAARSGYNAAAFLRAFLQKQAYDYTRALTHIGFHELEKTQGISKSDVNAFFGYMSMLLTGGRGDGGLFSGATRSLIALGSVDRIIQSMAYHTADIGGDFFGTNESLRQRSAARPHAATSLTINGIQDDSGSVFPEPYDALSVGLRGATILGTSLAGGLASRQFGNFATDAIRAETDAIVDAGGIDAARILV